MQCVELDNIDASPVYATVQMFRMSCRRGRVFQQGHTDSSPLSKEELGPREEYGHIIFEGIPSSRALTRGRCPRNL